jgi:hypothetical protein
MEHNANWKAYSSLAVKILHALTKGSYQDHDS